MLKVGLLGAMGYRASHGGFDNVVNNLVDKKKANISYYIYTPLEGNREANLNPIDARIYIPISNKGVKSLIFDFISTLHALIFCRVLFYLGMGPAIFFPIVKILSFGRKKIVVNIGGVEWERPHFSTLGKSYFKLCYWLCQRFSDVIIFDNQYFQEVLPYSRKGVVLPYGGNLLETPKAKMLEILKEISAVSRRYYLSVSRANSDNQIYELCEVFSDLPSKNLILISNFSSSEYGKFILQTFKDITNITLIDGLYDREKLDYVRKNCFVYIHTHTLCGTAPSLVEMIHAQVPILSIRNKQNWYTLNRNEEHFFNDYHELKKLITNVTSFKRQIPSSDLCNEYSWEAIVQRHEDLFFGAVL